MIGLLPPLGPGPLLALLVALVSPLPESAMAEKPAASPPPSAAPSAAEKPGPPAIDLTDQKLDDAALIARIEVGPLPAAVDITLSSNRIGPVGLARLLDGPRAAIQTLVLYDNRIGDTGARELAGPGAARGVSHLDVGFNGITIAGWRALVGPQSQLVGPTHLSGAGNAIGDAGVEALAAGKLPAHLFSLNLRRTGLTDAGARRLAAIDFPKLTALDVSGNPALGDAGVKALQAAPWARRVRIRFR